MLRVKRYIETTVLNMKYRYLNFLYKYDMNRYLRYSGMNRNNPELIAAEMRLLVHSIEKALSLRNIRPDFGRDKIKRLIELTNSYEEIQGKKDFQAINLAKSIITQYYLFRRNNNQDVSFIPKKFIDDKLKNISGTIDVSYEDFGRLEEFRRIAEYRHSIRGFAEERVNKKDIEDAVKLAQTSPSACNRQATRIYVCNNEEKCKLIMSKHGGMTGFSNVSAIIAITEDLNLYQNEYERNTVFLDGGIFVMNLLYSLQAYHIASCPIIWGAEPDNDSFIYDLLDIPEQNEIIAMVMVGSFPKDGAKAAKSYKRELDTILKFIE